MLKGYSYWEGEHKTKLFHTEQRTESGSRLTTQSFLFSQDIDLQADPQIRANVRLK